MDKLCHGIGRNRKTLLNLQSNGIKLGIVEHINKYFMENSRRSFLKKVSAAGIGAAGLAMTNQAAAATVNAET